MVAPSTTQPITVTEYHRLAETGVLTEDDRVELIAGVIVPLSPIGPVHATSVTRLHNFLERAIGHSFEIRSQNPVRLNNLSEPEPDVLVLQPRSYRQALPTPADVVLLIEVADSSLAADHGTKLPLYAAAGITEVFLVDLIGELLERHTEPQDGSYRRIITAGRGASVTSSVLPSLEIPVDVALGYTISTHRRDAEN
ncbi:MAG TPA: Uma2 family endonuclease [Chloroflexota bacterium]|jgi:Uma2 family endonuclease